MSEPAIFVFIENGQRRMFADRWGGIFLFRELVWGPAALEEWAKQFAPLPADELEYLDSPINAGVVVDLDQRTMIWSGEYDTLRLQRVFDVYARMLGAAWPGYQVSCCPLGIEFGPVTGFVCATTVDDHWGRPDRFIEAAGLDDDDEPFDNDDAEFDEDDEPFADLGAWVTIIDESNAVIHRRMYQLSQDIFRNPGQVLGQLTTLPDAKVPAEALVAEGIWIDQGKKQVVIWGDEKLRFKLAEMQDMWTGWNVLWSDNGYQQQCAAAGPAGQPLSDQDALSKILPVMLSAQRFDMQNLLGAIGSGLKRSALRATGCLFVFLCLPLVIFGIFSGQWRAVGISVAITFILLAAGFKYLEYRFKRSMRGKIPGEPAQSAGPPVAGPLDETQREARLNELLGASGLPSVESVRPFFPDESEADLLG
ncbi:MAG: hypothetical protein ACR2NP_00710 [Pirellulaceae bacterium]